MSLASEGSVNGEIFRMSRGAHLKDLNVRGPIGAVAAAVALDVFEPLNVRLSIAVHFTVELDVTSHDRCGVGW